MRLHTVSDYLNWGMQRAEEAQVYLGHGTDSLWDDVLAIVLHVMRVPHTADVAVLQQEVPAEYGELILQLFKRRFEEKIPAAYLVQQAWFAGLPFYVDERVIIPRSPIAELIENQFQPWIDQGKVSHVLDLCTGSACIAIAAAKALPNAKVHAVDICEDALAVAQKNVEMHQVQDQVTLIQSDMFSNIPPQRYDIIISNPPYVSEAEMSDLPAEYYHEPRKALYADDQGLQFAEEILFQAKHYLAPGGILIVEVGNSADALHDRYQQTPFLWLDFERGGDGVFLLTAEQCHVGK